MEMPKKNSPSVRPGTDQPFRIGVLGGGAVTSVYYLPALRQCPEIEVVAIVDPSPAALNEVRAGGYRGSLLQKTAEEFFAEAASLAALRLDGIVVAVPNFLHENTVCLALKNGLHVLCEKPLALTALSCSRIGAEANKAGRSVAVGMVRRLLPALTITKNLLDRGVLGELQEISLEEGGPYGWMSDSGAFFDPRSGGLLADMGVHYLDMLQALFGELRPVRYEDDFYGGCEADLSYELITRQEIPVKLTLSRYRRLRDDFTLRGSKATLRVPRGMYEKVLVEWPDQKAVTLYGEIAEGISSGNKPGELTPYFVRQFQEWTQRVRQNVSPFATVEEATRVTGLIEWAYQHRPPQLKLAEPRRPTLDASRITVTGGTGFIGMHLVERAMEMGCKVVVPVRNYRSCAEVARFSVRLPRTNLLDIAQVAEALRESRYVFHLAYGQSGKDAATVTIQGTKNVVEAAIANKAECVVILSTMFVFGRKHQSTVDETSPYQPTGGEYGESKAKMERWCLERAKTSGQTRIVVLNPSFVYGPGGKTFSVLPVRLAKDQSFCWVNGGTGSANYVYIDNLIDAMVLAARRPEAHGNRFLINDGDCSWKDFLTPVLGEYAARVPALSPAEMKRREAASIPSFLQLAKKLVANPDFRSFVKRLPLVVRTARLLAGLRPRRSDPSAGAAARGFTGNEAGVPPIWLAELFSSNWVNVRADKAKKVLHWAPAVDLAEGQKRTHAWLKRHGELGFKK